MELDEQVRPGEKDTKAHIVIKRMPDIYPLLYFSHCSLSSFYSVFAMVLRINDTKQTLQTL